MPDWWSKGGGKEGQGRRSKARKAKTEGKGSGGETAKTASTPDGDAFAFAVATDFAQASRQNVPILTRLLDSGASRHFDPCRTNVITFRDIAPKAIASADGRTFHATGEGDVRVTTGHNGKATQFILRDVLYAP